MPVDVEGLVPPGAAEAGGEMGDRPRLDPVPLTFRGKCGAGCARVPFGFVPCPWDWWCDDDPVGVFEPVSSYKPNMAAKLGPADEEGRFLKMADSKSPNGFSALGKVMSNDMPPYDGTAKDEDDSGG